MIGQSPIAADQCTVLRSFIDQVRAGEEEQARLTFAKKSTGPERRADRLN